MTKNGGAGSGDARRVDRRTALKAIGVGTVAAGIGGSASAQERFPPSERTQWGRPVQMGEGTMATFATLRGSLEPQYVGIWFTEDALDGLPEGGDEHHSVTPPLPANAGKATNFEWVGVDWAPQGHAPAEVYDVPHFDIHFYMMDRETVESEIPPGECDADGDGTPEFGVPCDVYERGTEPLPDAQRPAGYVSTDDVVPHMGNHWVDQNAPEFRGEPFTHTWIYGSFDGRLTFVEPMITREYLRGLDGRDVADVETPEAFPEAGYQPTQYSVRRLPRQDAYAVVLREFEEFDAA